MDQQKEQKQFYVEFEFPDLPGGCYRQSWYGTASSIGKASFEAFKEVRKRPAVKGRRLHRMKTTVIEMKDTGDS